MVVFIGDVHGKYKQYKNILKKHNDTIQVGDMGVGFFSSRTGRAAQNPPHYIMKETNARFIRGNHDNPDVCKRHSQYIADGHTEVTPKGTKIMFVGGALSIDKQWRTERYDYWADEELTQAELYEMMEIYEKFRPDVMVTHDCPELIAIYMKRGMKLDYPSITRQALDSMLWMHKPQLWLYGHWHESFRMDKDGTTFICLNELETMEIDI